MLLATKEIFLLMHRALSHAHKLVLPFLLFFFGVSIASTASAITYTFTELVPAGDGYRSYAFDINNVGQVVGGTTYYPLCFNCGATNRVTVWNGASPTSWGFAGYQNYAAGINDAGQVVGTINSRTTVAYRAFVLDSSSLAHTILPSRYSNEWGNGINNLGQVVGFGNYPYSPYPDEAILWDPGTSTKYLGYGRAIDINDVDQVVGMIGHNAVIWNESEVSVLGNLSGGYSVPETINNVGQVVGASRDAAGYRATLWINGTPINLGTLGGRLSRAYDINDSGIVVGESLTADNEMHAFMWDGNLMFDLNSLLDETALNTGWVLEEARGINERGQIVGTAYNSIAGRSSAFLLNPIPEPDTYVMIVIGLGLLGAFRLRRYSIDNNRQLNIHLQ